MIRSFGKDFKYKFTPFEDNEQIEGIPAHTATALIYSSQPTRSQVDAGTGAVATYTKAWVAGAKHIEFDIAGIADPDPTADVINVTYFIAIKFKTDADSGEGEQIDIRVLPLARPGGSGAELRVSVEDCRQKYSKIESLFSVEDIETEIKNQTNNVKALLKGKGFDWACIVQPELLKTVVAYYTLAGLLIPETLGEGDKFSYVGKHFKSEGDTQLKQLNIAYDESIVQGTAKQNIRVSRTIRCIR